MTTLMIVDDEENIRLGIAEGIDWQEYGIEVVCVASNGREALEMISIKYPDIIILDINMPYLNGIEFAEQASVLLPTSKIIVLTGYSEFEYAHSALKIGVCNYLLKPVAPTDLIEAVLKAKEILDKGNQYNEFLERLKLGLLDEALNNIKRGNDVALRLCGDYIDVCYVQNSIFKSELSKSIQPVFSKISSLLQQDLWHSELLDLCTSMHTIEEQQQFKTEFLRCLEDILNDSNMIEKNDSREEIDITKAHIRNNYSSSLRLDKLAKNVFMNPNYLASLFKDETGDTIGNYIKSIRMEQAKKMLTETQLSISEISEKVGFDNPNYFSSAFKKHVNISPTEFRMKTFITNLKDR